MSTVVQTAIISGIVGAVVLIAGVVYMANMVVKQFEREMAWLGGEIRRDLSELRDDVREDAHGTAAGGATMQTRHIASAWRTRAGYFRLTRARHSRQVRAEAHLPSCTLRGGYARLVAVSCLARRRFFRHLHPHGFDARDATSPRCPLAPPPGVVVERRHTSRRRGRPQRSTRPPRQGRVVEQQLALGGPLRLARGFHRLALSGPCL